MRNLGDYSTFRLYSSKQIALQDQLPTSFSFFWLKGQQEPFKSLGFLHFPVKFLLNEKAVNQQSSSITIHRELLSSLPVHAEPNLA